VVGREQYCGNDPCQREAARRRKLSSRARKVENKREPFPCLQCNYGKCRKPAFEISLGGSERRCERHAQNPGWKRRRYRVVSCNC